MSELRDVDMLAAPACPLDLSAATSEAAARTLETAGLRRERDQLLQRYHTRQASDLDVRRYRTVRLTLGLHHSTARMPDLPPSVDEALSRRADLIVELLVGPEVAGPPVAS